MGKLMSVGVLAGLLLVAPWIAQAAGLGELRVTSTLGQPLRGEIHVVSVQRGEEGLTASIASMDAYANAGLKRDAALTGTQLTIVSATTSDVVRACSSSSSKAT